MSREEQGEEGEWKEGEVKGGNGNMEMKTPQLPHFQREETE